MLNPASQFSSHGQERLDSEALKAVCVAALMQFLEDSFPSLQQEHTWLLLLGIQVVLVG